MTRMSRLARLLLVIVLMPGAARAAAQAPAQDPARQPVSYFELTRERLDKYTRALSNLARAGDSLRKAPGPADTAGDGSPGAIVEAMTKGCEQTAQFKSAVTAAEITCREYALFTLTLMQARVLSLGVQARGPAFLDSVPGGASDAMRANVRFATEHAAELEKLAAEQRKLLEKR